MNNLSVKNDIIEFKKYLERNHYSKHVIPIYIRKVREFLKQREVTLITKENQLELRKIINEYIAQLPLTSQKNIIQAALHKYYFFITNKLFIWRVNTKDYIANPSIEAEITSFKKYLDDFLGLCDNTITSHTNTIRQFLYSCFENKDFSPFKIQFNHVYLYITDTLSHLINSSKKTIITRIRNYIRFLDFSYQIKFESVMKLPMISPVWKRSSLPKYLTNPELNKIFDSYDKNKKYGIRDYAILRCLSDLGLRCSEVSNLSLDDFDWENSTVSIKNTKTNFERILPLPKSTGDSIIKYLLNCRPKTLYRILFVRYRNSIGKPMGTSQVRNTIRSAAVRAKLSNFTGTHMLRHTAAIKMLNAGVSLKTIADILGHESIETTCIYTKIDFNQLDNVAGVWPEVTL
jgi:site-specific recombinase XerD